ITLLGVEVVRGQRDDDIPSRRQKRRNKLPVQQQPAMALTIGAADQNGLFKADRLQRLGGSRAPLCHVSSCCVPRGSFQIRWLESKLLCFVHASPEIGASRAGADA